MHILRSTTGENELSVVLKAWIASKVIIAASLLNRTVFDETNSAWPAARMFASNLLHQAVTLYRLKSKCQDLSYSWLLN